MLKAKLSFFAVIFGLLAGANSYAVADAAALHQAAQIKSEFVTQLAESHQRHLQMATLQDIQEDLLVGIEKNKDRMNPEKFTEIQQQIFEYRSKESILVAEKEILDHAVSAANYLFMITRMNLEDGQDNSFLRFCLTPFAIAIDLVAFPFELLATMISGPGGSY